MLVFLLVPSWSFADDREQDVEKAKAGDFDAMFRVGITYLSDEDESNNDDGIKWLEMSSAGGNVVAYYNLGAFYQDGKFVKQNADKALLNLTVAAELGEVRAMNRLAGMYYVGKLVPRNDILAVKWGLCAAGLGSETAKKNVERMRLQIDQSSSELGGKAAEAWANKRLKTSDK